jgi:hypothetical protein
METLRKLSESSEGPLPSLDKTRSTPGAFERSFFRREDSSGSPDVSAVRTNHFLEVMEAKNSLSLADTRGKEKEAPLEARITCLQVKKTV